MDERALIIETIYRFANGLDLKNWKMVRACFIELIFTDYSDLRGDPPATISADDYITKRKIALMPLITQHLSSNHIVQIDDTSAQCKSQMVIFRRREGLYFNTHCYYEHTLKKTSAGWKISGIKQKVWWNEGNPEIHSGTK